MAYVNQNGQVRIGVRGWVPVFGPEDPGTPNTIDQDSTNFILASGISDSVQTSAIETLVSDLKAYGLWTKMKAIYPFVGGTASSHKFNLKDPRDLDAAYRLVFNGGWTHTSNGAKPNGTTGYADTKLVPLTSLSQNSTHVSYYSRTNNTTGGVDFGAANLNNLHQLQAEIKGTDGTTFFRINRSVGTSGSSISMTTSSLFYMINRSSSSQEVLFRNTTKNTFNCNSTGLSNQSLYLAAYNHNGSPLYYGNKESSFVTIGDGLTDTEASNFYISVQKFQTTLGRHVGTPYVSDPDAIAFLMAAGITDGTQAAAINTLVIRMKADGVWTKMKAIYPFVGGSATSHKFNLKDPRDLDAAFRLVFTGGWTHTGTGAKPNGSSYADTKLAPSAIGQNNIHISFYSRTDVNNSGYDIGSGRIGNAVIISPRETNNLSFYINHWAADNVSNTDSLGYYVGSRLSSSSASLFKNGVKIINSTKTSISPTPTANFYLGAYNLNGTIINYSTREQAFASIGDGLTDTDATNLYSAVQAYQTTLGRQVNIPVVSDTDAQSFLNAANITSFQQASAVNKLVIDLKAAGVWSKMKAIYPFVGGSAASHKFNLKDPRDLDAAYRLVFFGGGTHTSTGYQLNGSNSWANTYFTPSINWATAGKSSFGLYSTTDNTLSGRIAMGTQQGNGWVLLYLKDGTSNYALNNTNWASFAGPIDSSNDKRGFFQSSRNNSTTSQLYNKNSNNYTANSAYTGVSNIPIFIGTMNGSPNSYVENINVAFSYIGEDLSSTDLLNYYTAVQTYQTSLGRQVTTPIYNNGLVLNLDAGNANSYPGTGTTWFDLASGNNGTLVNGPTYDTTNGGSLYFDGTNKYTDISYTKINITNKLTISSWVYFLSQPSTTGNPNIVDKWDWPNNKRSFHIGTENGYLATSISYDGLFDNRIVCSDNSSIVLNQWINITMTYDGRTLKLYKNGSLIQSSSFSQDRNIFSDITTNIFLGRSRGTEGSSRHLNARISGVQIYSNSLTATEILNNFNSTRGRFGL